MAKLKFKGLEEYEKHLIKLQNISRTCIGEAIHEGAGLVADAVKQATESLPVDNRLVKDGEMLNGVSTLQKQGLIESFGIAKLQDDNGYINVKLGFDGYNGVSTKSYPSGQPNAVIARSVNSGTSFRRRIPFVDDTVNAKKAACEAAMKKKFDEALSRAL